MKLWRWRLVFNKRIHPKAITPTPWVYWEDEPVIGKTLPTPADGSHYEVEEFERVAVHQIHHEEDRNS